MTNTQDNPVEPPANAPPQMVPLVSGALRLFTATLGIKDVGVPPAGSPFIPDPRSEIVSPPLCPGSGASTLQKPYSLVRCPVCALYVEVDLRGCIKDHDGDTLAAVMDGAWSLGLMPRPIVGGE